MVGEMSPSGLEIIVVFVSGLLQIVILDSSFNRTMVVLKDVFSVVNGFSSVSFNRAIIALK